MSDFLNRNIAEFMAMNEEIERIPRKVFHDWESPIDTINNEQLILHIFDRRLHYTHA